MSIVTRTLCKGTYWDPYKPSTKWHTAQQKNLRHSGSRRLRTNQAGSYTVCEGKAGSLGGSS
jgi:hypothetical protein